MVREVMKRIRDPKTGKTVKDILSCGHEVTGDALRFQKDERICKACGPGPKKRTGTLKYGLVDKRGRLVG